MNTTPILLFLFLLPCAALAWKGKPGSEPETEDLEEIAVYFAAHQDDWQLFMGADAYRDIRAYDEKKGLFNGKKVIFIYTTAGNLHDNNDQGTCDCRNMMEAEAEWVPYWKVREVGAMNSVRLAACRTGGWGPGNAYRKQGWTMASEHRVADYHCKNTTSYFMRVRATDFGNWDREPLGRGWAIDSSTTYESRQEYVQTLYDLVAKEVGQREHAPRMTFHIPDTSSERNPEDHGDHLRTGHIGLEVADMIARQYKVCVNGMLYVDYHTKNLPANMNGEDAQNEAAMMGAYCLALLDYNAWPEWDTVYGQWTNRNYHRAVQVCGDLVKGLKG